MFQKLLRSQLQWVQNSMYGLRIHAPFLSSASCMAATDYEPPLLSAMSTWEAANVSMQVFSIPDESVTFLRGRDDA